MRVASVTLVLLVLGFRALAAAVPPHGHRVRGVDEVTVRAGGSGEVDTHGGGRDCQSCHSGQTGQGHPSGFVTQRVLPPGFRLEAGGRFTCRTCHDARRAGGALPACGQCHASGFFAAMADGGTSLRARAHPAAAVSPSADATACLDCHADHAGDGRAGAGRLVYASARAGPRNHPVGLRYERAVAYGGYVDVAVLPREVRLVDGRLSCVSCHRDYSARHGATVLPTAGSELCFACHDL